MVLQISSGTDNYLARPVVLEAPRAVGLQNDLPLQHRPVHPLHELLGGEPRSFFFGELEEWTAASQLQQCFRLRDDS